MRPVVDWGFKAVQGIFFMILVPNLIFGDEPQPGGSPLEARPTSAPGWNLRVPGPQAQNQNLKNN